MKTLRRFLVQHAMWWFIIAAAVGYIVLSDSGSGDSGPIGMPGPLLPGQDRPTY